MIDVGTENLSVPQDDEEGLNKLRAELVKNYTIVLQYLVWEENQELFEPGFQHDLEEKSISQERMDTRIRYFHYACEKAKSLLANRTGRRSFAPLLEICQIMAKEMGLPVQLVIPVALLCRPDLSSGPQPFLRLADVPSLLENMEKSFQSVPEGTDPVRLYYSRMLQCLLWANRPSDFMTYESTEENLLALGHARRRILSLGASCFEQCCRIIKENGPEAGFEQVLESLADALMTTAVDPTTSHAVKVTARVCGYSPASQPLP
ncbi:MAG: hypothetical protein M3O22_05410 [Pseudomonadota bacterium]|nr:hypothetical protein [Pseudomonadota bacterium]